MRELDSLGVRYVIARDWEVPDGCLAVARQGERLGLILRRFDPPACLLEVPRLPPLDPPPGRPVPAAAVRLATSRGDDPSAAIDGDLRTHWVQSVSREAGEDWLQIDLDAPRRLTRVRMRLGWHFGDTLRAVRVDVPDEHGTWTTLVAPRLLEPPLRGMRDSPDDLEVDVELPGTALRTLRLVRPRGTASWWDVYYDWGRWGVHELTLDEAAIDG